MSAAIPGSQPSTPAFRLAYKFLPKQDVRLRLTVDSQIQVQKAAAITIAGNQSTTERHFHVLKVEADGSAVIELHIDRVKLSYSFNNEPPTTYDTASSVDPPAKFQQVKDCIGRPATKVRVCGSGKMSSLDPASSAEGQFDASQNFLVVLPERPIHVGDEWFDDYDVKLHVSRQLSQKIKLRRKYKLESVKGDQATIRLETAELTPVDEPQLRAQMIQLTPAGTIVFDIKQGMITARDLRCERTETNVMGAGSQIAASSSIKETLQ